MTELLIIQIMINCNLAERVTCVHFTFANV